ncbi:hypothetical protein LMH87_010922 [Akanthomyces muscarius]|uniref:CST complex subunit STN1 n=1 Tax=Akanthomyces muscarius TaxID=2231603 RepID=A0A9W8Q8Y8_AKAMU|nr:hypothetical protein LMH87_010922 [Akanthomyces muscarius]KAJ4150159.1 hypothetical protein LMH87_010922 [Akanthomyces muscarius]
MSDTLEAVFYPRYCFHLAPTANAWCFLRTRDLFTLQQRDGFEGEGLYFHRNLPIKWVRIVGVVVAIDEFGTFRAFTIDDSSGACIEAVISLTAPAPASDVATTSAPLGPFGQPATPYDHIDVGSVVDVKGALTTFRDAKQLKVERMTVLRGTAEEMRLWVKRSAFGRDVLEKPWALPEKTVRKCRKEAERSEAEAERKRERFKAASARKTGNAYEAQKRQGAAGDKKERPSRSRNDAQEFIEVLASSKGKFNALGL